jgi:ribosome-associated protein
MALHRITAKITLDDDDCVVEGVRASGPGGQNVNKVSSAISLRLDLDRVVGMDAAMRERVAALAGRRLTDEGILVIKAQESRSQTVNREEAIARVLDILKRAAVVPVIRIKTKVGRGARARRLDSKRRRSSVKQMRRTSAED